MAQLSHAQVTRALFPDRATTGASAEKYHPHCGDQHRHKPAKALIGIALLILFSVLLYGVTGRASEPSPSSGLRMEPGSP